MRLTEKSERYEWARTALEPLRKELDLLLLQGEVEVPREPGGWWHQYVCPEHHAELSFDPLEQDAAQFVCPYGCKLTDVMYRGAWLVFKHQALARYALQAAAVYAATKDDSYARLARRIIVQYAEQFPRYPVHPDSQPWMLKGRAFHQALTEAIWATTLIRAYLLLRTEGVVLGSDESAAVDRFLSMLEMSMTEYRHILIHERGNPENNYTAWLNAALACVYAARGERDGLARLYDGEGGMRHHLTIGVKPDQFEFEGSTYYHVFVLRAYLIAAEMARHAGLEWFGVQGKDGQSLRGMLDVLTALADDDGRLPALHDGPYERAPYAREIAEIFEIGLREYGDDAYVPVLREAYRQLYGAVRRTGLEALVFGTGADDFVAGGGTGTSGTGLGDASAAGVSGSAGERAGSAGAGADNGAVSAARSGHAGTREGRQPLRPPVLLRHSGFAVLRRAGNPLSALADFGPHGGSHGHFDKLHLSLSHQDFGALSPDLGMVPYGSALRKEWYAETACHNTVSVGGQSQAPHTGKLMHDGELETGSYLWIRSDEAYPGCIMDRHLLLTDRWLLDWFEVRLEREQDIDWWFHALGNLRTTDSAGSWARHPEPVAAVSRHVACSGVRTGASAAADAASVWRLTIPAGVPERLESPAASAPAAPGGAVVCAMTTLLAPGSQLHKLRMPGPADDPHRLIGGLLHRQTGLTGRFVTVFAAGPSPAKLQWDGSSQQLRIAADGDAATTISLTDRGLAVVTGS
jgi:hypothetical protein